MMPRMNKRKKMPQWTHDLPAEAREELRKWLNPRGWDYLGAPGGTKRRAQNKLIELGLMHIPEEEPDRVRLAGKAAQMAPSE